MDFVVSDAVSFQAEDIILHWGGEKAITYAEGLVD